MLFLLIDQQNSIIRKYPISSCTCKRVDENTNYGRWNDQAQPDVLAKNGIPTAILSDDEEEEEEEVGPSLKQLLSSTVDEICKDITDHVQLMSDTLYPAVTQNQTSVERKTKNKNNNKKNKPKQKNKWFLTWNSIPTILFKHIHNILI